jgi:murein DD-endopeptidase MepM/ murein hydrolase activator NlpD
MKLNKIEIKRLLRLKSFSVLIVPDNTDSTAKSHRFSYGKMMAIISIYSLLIAFIGFLFFSITPVRGLIFSNGSNLSNRELNTIKELNERMIKLSKELNEIRTSDEKLKSAIKLTDSTFFQMENPAKNLRNKTGGNILSVFRELLIKFKLVQKEGINFIKPTIGFISRNFDPEKGHMGIDFVVKTGTPVYVSANGFVIFANYTVKDGNMIIVSHPGNYISVYKHCSSLIKKERDTVVQGELIALSGNTGEVTTGSHLHFEIWRDGKPINPITILTIN